MLAVGRLGVTSPRGTAGRALGALQEREPRGGPQQPTGRGPARGHHLTGGRPSAGRSGTTAVRSASEPPAETSGHRQKSTRVFLFASGHQPSTSAFTARAARCCHLQRRSPSLRETELVLPVWTFKVKSARPFLPLQSPSKREHKGLILQVTPAQWCSG